MLQFGRRQSPEWSWLLKETESYFNIQYGRRDGKPVMLFHFWEGKPIQPFWKAIWQHTSARIAVCCLYILIYTGLYILIYKFIYFNIQVTNIQVTKSDWQCLANKHVFDNPGKGDSWFGTLAQWCHQKPGMSSGTQPLSSMVPSSVWCLGLAAQAFSPHFYIKCQKERCFPIIRALPAIFFLAHWLAPVLPTCACPILRDPEKAGFWQMKWDFHNWFRPVITHPLELGVLSQMKQIFLARKKGAGVLCSPQLCLPRI